MVGMGRWRRETVFFDMICQGGRTLALSWGICAVLLLNRMILEDSHLKHCSLMFQRRVDPLQRITEEVSHRHYESQIRQVFPFTLHPVF